MHIFQAPLRFMSTKCSQLLEPFLEHFITRSYDSHKQTRLALGKLAASTGSVFCVVSHSLEEKSTQLFYSTKQDKETFLSISLPVSGK